MNLVPKKDIPSVGFSTIRQGSAPRKLQINPQQERITTIIGAASCVEGSLRIKEGIKIDGCVKGDLTFGIEDGLCILSAGALLEGNLRGPKALILGEVQGNVEVQSTLVLAPSAVIVGLVKCGSLVVYDGASVTGSIETIRQAAPVIVSDGETKKNEPAITPNHKKFSLRKLFSRQ